VNPIEPTLWGYKLEMGLEIIFNPFPFLAQPLHINKIESLYTTTCGFGPQCNFKLDAFAMYSPIQSRALYISKSLGFVGFAKKAALKSTF
jgi:hypothetical protein